jgi:hypothetical protein
VDDVKTIYSGKLMSVDVGILEVLEGWRKKTQFSQAEDWIFASPVRLGRLRFPIPGFGTRSRKRG